MMIIIFLHLALLLVAAPVLLLLALALRRHSGQWRTLVPPASEEAERSAHAQSTSTQRESNRTALAGIVASRATIVGTTWCRRTNAHGSYQGRNVPRPSSGIFERITRHRPQQTVFFVSKTARMWDCHRCCCCCCCLALTSGCPLANSTVPQHHSCAGLSSHHFGIRGGWRSDSIPSDSIRFDFVSSNARCVFIGFLGTARAASTPPAGRKRRLP